APPRCSTAAGPGGRRGAGATRLAAPGEEVGGDLVHADRDPWAARAGPVLLPVGGQFHGPLQSGCATWFRDETWTGRDPNRLGFVMQPLCAKITRMLRRDYPNQACSLAHSLEVIGERWSLLIVRDVMNGNRRFSGIQASLGIARNVLSARLQRLIDEDILERRAYQESPPRYEYFLTEKGLDLWPALIALMGWGDRHSGNPEGPPLPTVHKHCGGALS